MEKEGSALADRPPMIAAGEILSGSKRMVLTSSGDRLRRFKKVIHTHLQPIAVESYKEIQFEHATALILGLLDDPKNHQKLAHRYVSIHCIVFVMVSRYIVSGMLHQSSCASRMAGQAPHLSTIQRSLE